MAGMARRLLRPIDVVAVIVVIVMAVFMAGSLHGVHGPTGQRLHCVNNVRNLAGLLAADLTRTGRLHGRGPAMLLWFVHVREIDAGSADRLSTLFCPADTRDSLQAAGGPTAFRDLDLTREDLGRFTSYAGRDPGAPGCAVSRDTQPPVVLVSDDSDDHHGAGVVVGFSDGSARLLSLEPPESPRIEVGPESILHQLRCLRAE